MNELLQTYWPYILGGLGLFLKPGPKPVWKIILDTVVKPPAEPAPPGQPVVPSNLLSMLPALIAQLANKQPVTTTPAPPDPAKIPTDPSQLIAWVLQLLNAPEAPTPHIESRVDKGDIAHLLGCANAVAAKNPDCDVVISIDKNGVDVEVKKREQPAQSE